MNDDTMYVIDIHTENEFSSLADEIRSLSPKSKSSSKSIDDDTVLVTEITKDKTKPKKNKKEKKSKSLLIGAFDTDEDDDAPDQEEDEQTLLDIDTILREREDYVDGNDIVKEQKKGYKKLKKGDNDFKKEFAEELTLLYSLLDETSKFGKSLEKDYVTIKGTRARGVSKYANDMAELILSSKQNKLNILKEISAIKKTVADLKIKSESKDKKGAEAGNNAEHIASSYLKNILNYGRGNFVNALSNGGGSDDEDSEYDSIIDKLEGGVPKAVIEDDGERYNKMLIDRLEGISNPYRSEAGNKYIQYENRGVKLYVKKCIDTGDWEFAALDKNQRQIYDYPLPSKRDAGRMRFSDDGTYATDAKGRMYNVIEYFLPENEDDEDEY